MLAWHPVAHEIQQQQQQQSIAYVRIYTNEQKWKKSVQYMLYYVEANGPRCNKNICNNKRYVRSEMHKHNTNSYIIPNIVSS